VNLDAILGSASLLWAVVTAIGGAVAGGVSAWFGMRLKLAELEAKQEARGRELDGKAIEALRQAGAIGRALDAEKDKREKVEKDLLVTQNDLKHAQGEIVILRKVRHDVVDTLNGVVQFLANAKEGRDEAEKLRARIRELESVGQ